MAGIIDELAKFMRGEPEWRVEMDGDGTVPLRESRVRDLLRDGELSGMERAFPPGSAVWQPLYTHPIFSEEVPHDGDARAKAQERADRARFLIVAGVSGGLIAGGLAVGALAWFLAMAWILIPAVLLGMAGATVGVVGLLRSRPALLAPVEAPEDPEVAGVLAAVARVRQAAGVDPRVLSSLEPMAEVARDLVARRARLREGAASVPRLEVEIAELQQRIFVASAALRPALSEELDALRSRLAAAQVASDAAEELSARLRVLGHRLGELELTLTTAAEQGPSATDAADAVSALVSYARATGEVEAVARAGRAARAGMALP